MWAMMDYGLRMLKRQDGFKTEVHGTTITAKVKWKEMRGQETTGQEPTDAWRQIVGWITTTITQEVMEYG